MALISKNARNALALAVAIVQNGMIAFARTFGTADDQTRFRIASLTNSVRSLAVRWGEF
jgi:CubicO group peptidase (beta-lactamase class C family)